MNGHLQPEQRTNVNGVTQTKWIRPLRPPHAVHGSTQFPPPPTAAPQPDIIQGEFTVDEEAPVDGPAARPKGIRRALYEHAVDKLISFVIGPEERDGAGTALLRGVLREKLYAVPERTARGLVRGYEAAVAWGERTLPQTEFGRFDHRIREGLTQRIMSYDPNSDASDAPELALDEYAARLWATAREFLGKRKERIKVPPKPRYAPTIHLREQNDEVDEFMERVETIEVRESDYMPIDDLVSAASDRQRRG